MASPPDPDQWWLAFEDLRPTQLYLSAAKLAAVLDRVEEGGPSFGPLPAFEHDGEWYLSDGHTRAFAAYLCGAEGVEVHRDGQVREEYDFDLYLTCIEWCREEGVRTVADFPGRVLPHGEFEEQWIRRCRRAADDREG